MTTTGATTTTTMTTTAVTTDPAPTPGRLARMNVRTQVMGVLLALTALGLAVAGLTTYLLQRERTDERIDDSLTRTVTEFRQDAARAGQGAVVDVLRSALQQTVPAPSEGTIALVDGTSTWYAPRTVRVRLEEDPELVAALARASSTEARLTTITTPTATYRVATTPVRVEGDPARGLYVVASVRDQEMAALASTWRTYTLVALGALVVLAVVGWLVLGRVLRPLDHLRSTAQRINETDLAERIPVSGHDDVAELTRTVNAMLDRLESSFTGQRQLLDDVGHELRTPLTIIGGHLELMDVTDTADVAATRALALDEVDRMRGLVDDLLVLARTDRPDFVRPEPTAIGILTDDVLDKARALGDRVWRVADRADVEVEADASRLTQAWLQLVSNAVKFSAPGSPVTLGSALVDGRVRLWVHDEGRGIAPADLDRIFERFARGRDAHDAGIEGSGLGLAIVAAIAAGHGGRVDVTSTPGVGSTFVIDLPARPVPTPLEEVP